MTREANYSRHTERVGTGRTKRSRFDNWLSNVDKEGGNPSSGLISMSPLAGSRERIHGHAGRAPNPPFVGALLLGIRLGMPEPPGCLPRPNSYFLSFRTFCLVVSAFSLVSRVLSQVPNHLEGVHLASGMPL